MGGASEFLPVQVLIQNQGKRTIHLRRESFVLERPDGTRLPVCTDQEWRRDYQRSLADEHLAKFFIDSVAGRFPEPPYHWERLDFFPLRTESTVPRDEIDVRMADVVYGYIYFRQPDLGPRAVQGRYKLLVSPLGADVTYVVDLVPYAAR